MVSVIVLNRNGGEHFKDCINAVLSSSYQDFEILIRENGSVDGSREWIESLSDPRIHLFVRENSGNFSTMNNEIAKQSTGDLLLFLNNDVKIDHDTIQNMVRLLVSDPYLGSVGALLRYPSGKIQHAGIVCGPGKDPINLSDEAITRFRVDRNFLSDVWEHRAVTAACVLMRKSDFNRVNGFDPQYNWAYEDVDLSLKIHFHLNKKNVVSPECTGVHIEGASSANPDLPKNLEKFSTRWKGLFQPDYATISTRRYSLTPSKEISFIVCVNNFDQLNNILVKSVYHSRDRYEMIPIYNFDGSYSAAKSLNLGMDLSSTDWQVFTHQDVEYSRDWIDLVFSEVSRCPNMGVAGLAGVKIVSKKDTLAIPLDSGRIHINCIGAVRTPEPNGKSSVYGQFHSGEVDVVDELCVIKKRSTNLRFDESTLTHFHFYAVDLSLSSRHKGLKNYVLNASATHHSNGSSSLSKGRDLYWREFHKVHDKWKRIFPKVCSTTGFWSDGRVETFYKDETKAEKPIDIPSSDVAQTIQILIHESVELTAKEHGEWIVNGVSAVPNSKTFRFKPFFSGLHKITHRSPSKISDWWIQTVRSNKEFVSGMSQSFHTHQLGEIYGGKIITQEILCDRNDLSKVELFVGTFRRKNACILSVHIEDENGALLRSAFLDSAQAQDNDWNEFVFEPIPDSKNRKLRLRVFSQDAAPRNALTVYYVNHSFSFGNLYQNEKKITGCLSFRLFYQDSARQTF